MSLVKIDFRSGSVRLALATQLDKSRNGKRPSATAVAAQIAMLMNDERWKTQENVNKIKDWLAKNMPTHDANALLNWFNSEDRDKTEWIKATKSDTALQTKITSCSLDTIKPPFMVARAGFISLKEWIKKYFKQQETVQKNTAKSNKKQQAAAQLIAASSNTCKLCGCTCTLTESGRGLANVQPCSLHREEIAISQMFHRTINGEFMNTCAYCAVRCIRCGCMALRGDYFVSTTQVCSSNCRKGHMSRHVEFRIVARQRKSNSMLKGGNIFDIAETCVECDKERNLVRRKKTRTNRENRENKAMLANISSSPSSPSSPLPSPFVFVPLPEKPLTTTDLDSYDEDAAKRYQEWTGIKTMQAKRTMLRQIAIDSSVLYERADFLYFKLFPKLLRESKKEKAKD